MTSKSISLSVRPRGKPVKNLPDQTEIKTDATLHDLYHRLAASSNVSLHRLRITKGNDGSLIPNTTDVTIDRLGLREQSVVYIKDLGPQIAWRTVFLIEYLGPILIHPLLYLTLAPSPASSLQTLTLLLVTLHFVKRELETLFVHRFSAATMPVRNVFKNSAHYWLLAGVNLAFWAYRPSSPTARPSNPWITYPAVALYAVSELGNLATHLTLRNLRGEGSTARGIPSGIGFGLVTCPNYMFEVFAWLAIWLVTWSAAAGLFVVVAGVQMALWAKKKETRYRKEFGSQYVKKKYAMIPGII
ncbi:MAG: hypothetical protein M1825_001624 [Sarcosagium campestre]|nr:MAG: hypothetical protein M1825_001624 [Sarcosagium campestre]